MAETMTETCFAYITLNPGEILAFRPQAGAFGAVYGRNGSNTVSLLLTGSYTTVDYWIFSKHVPSGIRYGIEVYDGNAQMIFDSGRPVMNVIGSHDGVGGPVSWGASGIAVIPWQTYAEIERRVSGQAAGSMMLTAIFTLDVISASGNQTSVATRRMAGAELITSSNLIPQNWPYKGSNNVATRYMVISTDNL
ncbi:hypothetical protein [Achromobacter aegrifaciens]